MKIRPILLSIICLAFLGCHHPNIFGDPTTDHEDLLNEWTRKKSFYGIENVEYFTYVTYKTAELRKAYVDEYADRYHLPEEKKNAMLKSEMDENANYDVFMVSHYSTRKEANKITKEPKVWRLTLSTSEDPVSGSEPVSVMTVGQNTDPVLAYFYPYITPWSTNLLVKFNKQPSSEKLFMRMSGVVADLVFSWSPPNGK